MLGEGCLFMWCLVAPAWKTLLLTPLDRLKNFKIQPEQCKEVDVG